MPVKPYALPVLYPHAYRCAEVVALKIDLQLFPDLYEPGTLAEYLHPTTGQVKYIAEQARGVLIPEPGEIPLLGLFIGVLIGHIPRIGVRPP